MKTLDKTIVNKKYAPIKILQFGEGNFLRAFVDWIIKKMNDSNIYNGHVVVVQPLEVGRIKELEKQDGLYTLYLQGINNNQVVREHEVIDCLDDFINPYTDYDKYLKYAESETLELCISNTTEAGIRLDINDTDFSKIPNSYPGKVLALLRHRYEYFNKDYSKGLSFICCELIDNNGDELKRCIIELSLIKGYDNDFIDWINKACHFTSTLVDRIVPGYPKDEIEAITNELGYIDNNIVKGEIFHFWVLNKEPKIMEIFPCDKANLNCKYVDSIKPYKERKVKILNGCHTLMVPVSYLSGIDTVRESILNEYIEKFSKKFVYDEVIPTINLDKQEMNIFANSVFERYLNPFVRHELMSIALNSISKYKERILKTVKDYYSLYNSLPKCALFSLAALIKFYFGKRGDEDIKLNDNPSYIDFFTSIKDLSEKEIVGKVLGNIDLFGEDLNLIREFNDLVHKYLVSINKIGTYESLKLFLNGEL